jgi:hypothetical protein
VLETRSPRKSNRENAKVIFQTMDEQDKADVADIENRINNKMANFL